MMVLRITIAVALVCMLACGSEYAWAGDCAYPTCRGSGNVVVSYSGTCNQFNLQDACDIAADLALVNADDACGEFPEFDCICVGAVGSIVSSNCVYNPSLDISYYVCAYQWTDGKCN